MAITTTSASKKIAFVRNKEELIKKFGADEVALATKYLWEADTVADKMVEYIRNDETRQAKKLFDKAIESGIDSIENPPKIFEEYFKDSREVPSWVDWNQLERGSIAITRMLLMGPFSLTVPLGATYVSHQAKSLAITGHLEKRAETRMVESTIFFSKIFKPNNMKPGNAGFKEAINLRLIHAFARSQIGKSPMYDAQIEGAPINQYDTACGQFYYFSTLFMEIAEKFGLDYSYQEKADIFALWRYICYLMGVPDAILAKNVEEATKRAELLKATFEPNDDSRALLKALVENTPVVDILFLTKVMPERVSQKIVEGGYYNQLKYAAFRLVLGDDVADQMAVPRSKKYSYMLKILILGLTASYKTGLKQQVNKLSTVNYIARIGEGLIQEYYQLINANVGLIDNSAV